jgi:hypothetical protein
MEAPLLADQSGQTPFCDRAARNQPAGVRLPRKELADPQSVNQRLIIADENRSCANETAEMTRGCKSTRGWWLHQSETFSHMREQYLGPAKRLVWRWLGVGTTPIPRCILASNWATAIFRNPCTAQSTKARLCWVGPLTSVDSSRWPPDSGVIQHLPPPGVDGGE